MSNSRKYVKIKDKEIPVIIRNYKSYNKIKMFFKQDVLNISKPRWYSINKIIKEYGDELYNKYIEITAIENGNIKYFKTGEQILYKGELYKIVRNEGNLLRVDIQIDEINKILNITIPMQITDENEIRENIVKCIKKLFKNNTTVEIKYKLEFWCKKMNLEYSSFKINDTTSKYGSCMPKSKRLFFSLRLVMLPDEIIDLIVVHELAHLVHPNHSKEFYNLIKEYITDYEKKDKWLKENSNLVNI